MNWLKEQYRETGIYFRKMLLWPLGFCTLLMLATASVSWLLLAKNPAVLEQVMQGILGLFDGKSLTIDGKISSLLLLANNLIAVFLSIALGLIPFFFLPLLTLAANASIIGAMGAINAILLGRTAVFWAGILPHGIFEIPAMLLGAAAGLRLSFWVLNAVFHREQLYSLKEMLMESSRFYVLVIAPLLVAASVIEAYLTPIFMMWVSG